MSSEYLDLNSLTGSGEELVEPLESATFSTRRVAPVGNYISQSRKITAKRRDDGHITFCLEFVGGVQHEDTGQTWAEKFPLRAWLSTKPYAPDESNPLAKTSAVAEYLRAVGFNPKGLDLDNLIDSMMESQTLPVQLFLTRTDRGKKQADGTYTRRNLRGKSFLHPDSTKENPIYLDVVEIDGEIFEAEPKVSSFRKVA